MNKIPKHCTLPYIVADKRTMFQFFLLHKKYFRSIDITLVRDQSDR